MTSSITSATDMTASITQLNEARTLMYVFEVSLEIKEDDGKVVFIAGLLVLELKQIFLTGHFFNSG